MLLDELLSRHLVFVGGKGGVGKTTTAAALALEGATRGRRCLVVSTDPAHSLADIFDQPLAPAGSAIADGLTGLEIDPDREAEQHLATIQAQMKGLVHPRLYDEIDRQMTLARHAPGATEAALLERVARLMGDEGTAYDLIVFDTAPSGHTVRLLSLPEIMGAWTDGLLRQRDRAASFSSALRHLGGGRSRGDDLSMIDAAEDHAPDSPAARIQATLGARRRRFLVARERLLDASASAFLLVANPDKLSILESRKVRSLLEQFDLQVAGLLINRVLPAEATGDAAGFWTDRRAQERTHLRELDETFSDLPRLRLPLLRRDVHGLDAIRDVARALVAAGSPA